MCGNGSRCAVRFAFDEGIVGKEVRFETLAGGYKGLKFWTVARE
jgi:diaminopimelate epimerase